MVVLKRKKKHKEGYVTSSAVGHDQLTDLASLDEDGTNMHNNMMKMTVSLQQGGDIWNGGRKSSSKDSSRMPNNLIAIEFENLTSICLT